MNVYCTLYCPLYSKYLPTVFIIQIQKDPFAVCTVEPYNTYKTLHMYNTLLCVQYGVSLSYSEKGEGWLTTSQKLALRVLWAYFFDVTARVPHQPRPARSLQLDAFINQMYPGKKATRTPLPTNLRDALEICRAHAAANSGWPTDELRILLLVDEIAKAHQSDAILRELCSAVNSSARTLLLVVSAIDALLIKEDAIASRRGVQWIELRALDDAQVRLLFHDLYSKLSTDIQRRTLVLLIAETGGHARLLENVFREFQLGLASNGKTWKPKFDELVSSVLERTFSGLPKASISAIALGLLGEPVEASVQIPGETLGKMEVTVNQLVKWGFYNSSANDYSMQPSGAIALPLRLAGLQVRFFLSLTADTTRELKPDTLPASNSAQTLIRLLKKLLDTETHFGLLSPRISKANLGVVDNVRGQAFEQFHCFTELIQLHARAVCDPFLQTAKTDPTDSMGVQSIVNGHFVKASLRAHYRLDNVSKGDRQLFNALLWPLASDVLVDTSQSVAPGERIDPLVADLEKARSNPNFVPPVRLFGGNMPGFDAAIVVREAKCPSNVWCILLELKHSRPDVSTRLSLSAVNAKVSTCLKHKYHERLLQKASRLVYVVVAWREPQVQFDISNWNPSDELRAQGKISSGSPFPYSVLILDKTRLENFYTSLKPYASFFAGDKLLEVLCKLADCYCSISEVQYL